MLHHFILLNVWMNNGMVIIFVQHTKEWNRWRLVCHDVKNWCSQPIRMGTWEKSQQFGILSIWNLCVWSARSRDEKNTKKKNLKPKFGNLNNMRYRLLEQFSDFLTNSSRFWVFFFFVLSVYRPYKKKLR